MPRALLMIVALLTFAGCARVLGYAGAHPGYVRCTGKGTITGTGAGALGAGLGGAEANHFTLQADCGDGFTFEQGRPAPSR